MKDVVAGSFVATSCFEGDGGGSYEVEAPRSSFLGGSGAGALPSSCGGPRGRVGLLLVLGAEPAAPRDFPLAQHGPEARSI
jgi:hypothetical protein